MTDTTFALALRAALTEHGVSAYALALRSGLTQGALSRLLAGSRQPSLDTARRIAHALGITLDQLCHALSPVTFPRQ